MIKRGISVSLVLVLLVLITGCSQSSPNPNYGPQDNTADGRVVFTISDPGGNLTSVTSVKITVDEISVHSVEKSWINVSNTEKTYDLLELKNDNNEVLLADTQIEEGTYTQVRLHIKSVVVMDADGNHEAKLPSNELKIIGDLNVAANTTSSVKFDFIVDESLHVTGNGEYILAPVVEFETTEDADDIKIDNEDKVEVMGGNSKGKVKVGMDENGMVGVGLGISDDLNLTIGSDNKIKINPPGLY